ncbi:hypothetical protein [Actinomadura alba]|uniref:DUF4439 domain-containing protein n=1 Tax=Actinomadura alba TaxID=406431 RepID=A0ABR7LI02_9ACTN|nr:hypothetical protein [Actinomadura alba]MBC6464298.1 hypothetical protein [Actinomadura alba]
MTGPEHYREAERLAKQANHWTYGDGGDPVAGAALAAEAQVHATLALAAATALMGSTNHARVVDANAWQAVAGEKPNGGSR